MRDKKRGAKPKSILWTEARLEVVTQELVREGLFKPETVPMIPKLQFPKEALSPSLREFDLIFFNDQQAPWDKIFRDEAQGSARWLSAHYPGFLHDGLASELMRHRPSNLRESIARDLVEGTALEYFSTKFRITAFLISRGVTEEGSDENLPLFPKYSWRDFLHYQPKVDRLIRSAKSHYFGISPSAQTDTKATVWERFDVAWKKLSIKQRSALEIHFMNETM